jgi:hypothetical protein
MCLLEQADYLECLRRDKLKRRMAAKLLEQKRQVTAAAASGGDGGGGGHGHGTH